MTKSLTMDIEIIQIKVSPGIRGGKPPKKRFMVLDGSRTNLINLVVNPKIIVT